MKKYLALTLFVLSLAFAGCAKDDAKDDGTSSTTGTTTGGANANEPTDTQND